MKRIYIIAAEKSGDQHAGALINSIKIKYKDCEFRGVGGQCLQERGTVLLFNYQEINFMGIWEVMKNIVLVANRIKEIKKDILEYRPDAIIHVDSSSLNMRIARFALEHKIPRIYYIAPKVWAWNTGRVFEIKKLFDLIFVIFPFEKTFYSKYNVNVVYAGNPTYEAISNYHLINNIKGKYVALLPGSRIQEIKSVMDKFAELADKIPSINFIVAGISSIGSQPYEKIAQKTNVRIVYDATYSILSQANAAIVVSGTATFETALFNIPQVVVYKTSWLTYFLARLVLRVKYISLVNLVADKQVVKELIQHDFSVENLIIELTAILTNRSVREQILLDYSKLKEALGEPNASDVAADEIGKFLKLS